MFPAQSAVFEFFSFLINLIISETFFVCPCAVSTTIMFIPSFSIAFALASSFDPAPTAAPTNNFCFLTFFISSTCFFIFKLRWIMPMPPALAIAIAILLSVIVSIAEVNNGIFSLRNLDNIILVSTSDGSISEYFGANVTSSKVRASFIGSIFIYI